MMQKYIRRPCCKRVRLSNQKEQPVPPLDLDITSGPLARRLRGMRSDEPLPRACGFHRRPGARTVVDATAGLCRDAMVLAQLGCQVTAVERVPALAFLAHDAIENSWLAPRLQVIAADATGWLANLAAVDRPDVVCLDPMFEQAGGAQVKKGMQVCRALAGPPGGEAALLQVALRVARERVVVKRNPDAPPLAPGVSFAVDGKRIRFDVYLTAPQ